MAVGSCEFESHLLHQKRIDILETAEIAQLVEHNLAAKIKGSNLGKESFLRLNFQ